MPSYSLAAILLRSCRRLRIDGHLLTLERHNLRGTKVTKILTLYKEK